MSARPVDVALDDRGSTLIELAVAAAIFIVILASILSVADSGTKAERQHEARSRTIADLRGVMTLITKDVRQAIEVDPASGASRIDMRSLFDGSERRVVYDILDGSFRRALDGGAPSVMAEGVASLAVFCYDPPACVLDGMPNTIRVSLALVPDVFGDAQTLRTEVMLRNS